MDFIEQLAIDMCDGAKGNYEECGYIIPAVLLVMDGMLNALPQQLADLMHSDKDKFQEVVRTLVKKHNPLAVAIISEAWCLDIAGKGKVEQPSRSPDRIESIFVTVDSREKQIFYHAEIKNKKLGKWVKGPVYFKTDGEVETSGNMVDFYGSGSALNLPIEMHEAPTGDGKVPKID